jgi:hypothetical protein
MKLGMPVYQGVNMLDVAGPLEMFYWAGQSKPLESVLVSADGGAHRHERRPLRGAGEFRRNAEARHTLGAGRRSGRA